MIKVAMTKENGEVGYIISPSMDDDYIDNQQYGEYTARLIPTDSIDDEYIFGKYWSNGWNDKGMPLSEYYEWINNEWVLNTEWVLNAIKIERTKLLGFSDWTVLPDNSLTESERAEWTIYRQALRDVPQNNTGLTNPDNVIWPTKPGG